MPHATHKQVNVGIFAKAPVAGLAKTRLIPRLGPRGAADLQRRLIERTVRTACEANVGPVSLWCSPSKEHDVFAQMRDRYGVALCSQSNDDLGARMHHAFSSLAADASALLLGCDCVTITSEILVECSRLINGNHDAVFIPVEDGGYILVGLKKPEPHLFDAMSWGTANVMAETRVRASILGLRVAELKPLWDIDEPNDYDRAVLCNLL